MNTVNGTFHEDESSSLLFPEAVNEIETKSTMKGKANESVICDYSVEDDMNTMENFETNSDVKNLTKVCSNSKNTSLHIREERAESLKPALTNMEPESDLSKHFNSFKSNTFQHSSKKINNPNNGDPLATLLMCKQLQTPIEYNVQFTSASYQNRSRNNSLCKTEEIQQNMKKNENEEMEVDGSKNNGESTFMPNDECEMLRHYKVLDNQIFLRDSNEVWNILSAKDASFKLQPIKEPSENQSITFQVRKIKFPLPLDSMVLFFNFVFQNLFTLRFCT